MKKLTFIFAVTALIGLLAASSSMAFSVTSNANNAFEVVGPSNDFTNWAVAGGATNNGFVTFLDAPTGEWMSGSQTPDAWANISIPFTFDSAVVTARLDYGAICYEYGWNWGEVDLNIVVDGVATQIFHGTADKLDDPYNYTASQTPPRPLRWWRGYTDITGLVKGKMAFDVQVVVNVGHQDYYVYNGGQFLPKTDKDSEFYLTGTTVGSGGISGKVILADYSQSSEDVLVKMTLSQEGALVSAQNVKLSADGSFIMTDVAPGTYTLSMKPCCWLGYTVMDITVPQGGIADAGTSVLVAGDVDGDNEVTSTDLSILGLNLGMTGD